MDALVTAVLQSAPSWGVGGLLVTYIVILIRREARVDESHGVALTRQAQLHTAELDRLNRDHDTELAELHARIKQQREELNSVYQELSEERARRLGLPSRRVGAPPRTLDDDE